MQEDSDEALLSWAKIRRLERRWNSLEQQAKGQDLPLPPCPPPHLLVMHVHARAWHLSACHLHLGCTAVQG